MEWSSRRSQRSPVARGAVASHAIVRPDFRRAARPLRAGATTQMAYWQRPVQAQEPDPPTSTRRRRRVSPYRRWLPTIAVVGVVAFLTLFLVIRQVVASRSVTPAQPTGEVTFGAESRALAPEAAPLGSDSTQPAPAPARTVRFTVVPVEPTYTVSTGDTLSAIAQRYNTSIDALIAINNLPDRTITLRVGQRLILP